MLKKQQITPAHLKRRYFAKIRDSQFLENAKSSTSPLKLRGRSMYVPPVIFIVFLYDVTYAELCVYGINIMTTYRPK